MMIRRIILMIRRIIMMIRRKIMMIRRIIMMIRRRVFKWQMAPSTVLCRTPHYDDLHIT